MVLSSTLVGVEDIGEVMLLQRIAHGTGLAKLWLDGRRGDRCRCCCCCRRGLLVGLRIFERLTGSGLRGLRGSRWFPLIDHVVFCRL